jgi:hypothetical protein
MADTPSVLVVKDASTPPITRTLGGGTDGAGTFYQAHSLRSDGVPVGAAAPLPVLIIGPQGVVQAGSTGVNFSANAATVPISGLVLLTTVPATPGRAYVEIQNQSAAMVQVVRDDGLGNNQTSILIASGSAAGTQGGSWFSATFKGRIRVYGASGAQVAAYQD